MSVLLENVKMPDCCWSCGLFQRRVDDGYYDYCFCGGSGERFNDYYDKSVRTINDFRERLPSCPLKEVFVVKAPKKAEVQKAPEWPTGKYILREDALQTAAEYQQKLNEFSPAGAILGLQMMASFGMIKDADVAERQEEGEA